jgi:Tol biopolymer transport system component
MGRKVNNEIIWGLYYKDTKTGEEKLLLDDVIAFQALYDKEVYYFKKVKSKYEIGKISLNNFVVIPIATVGSLLFPSISSEGTKVAFVRGNQIWTLNLLSLKESQITNTKKEKCCPVWTKDGKYIIYSTGKELFKIAVHSR